MKLIKRLKEKFFPMSDPELIEAARKVYYGQMPLSPLDICELQQRCGRKWREKLDREIARLEAK